MSDHSVTKEQPAWTPDPVPARTKSLRSRAAYLQEKITTREGWFGDYDYAWLCSPSLPFSIGKRKPRRRTPPFYALDSELPILLAIACGLQHALAMLAGLITPPIIFASALNLDSETSAYLISASLIGCGKCQIVWHDIPHETPARSNLNISRNSKSRADVAPETFWRILPWHWLTLCGWDQFCNFEHCKRREFTIHLEIQYEKFIISRKPDI